MAPSGLVIRKFHSPLPSVAGTDQPWLLETVPVHPAGAHAVAIVQRLRTSPPEYVPLINGGSADAGGATPTATAVIVATAATIPEVTSFILAPSDGYGLSKLTAHVVEIRGSWPPSTTSCPTCSRNDGTPIRRAERWTNNALERPWET